MQYLEKQCLRLKYIVHKCNKYCLNIFLKESSKNDVLIVPTFLSSLMKHSPPPIFFIYIASFPFSENYTTPPQPNFSFSENYTTPPQPNFCFSENYTTPPSLTFAFLKITVHNPTQPNFCFSENYLTPPQPNICLSENYTTPPSLTFAFLKITQPHPA